MQSIGQFYLVQENYLESFFAPPVYLNFQGFCFHFLLFFSFIFIHFIPNILILQVPILRFYKIIFNYLSCPSLSISFLFFWLIISLFVDFTLPIEFKPSNISELSKEFITTLICSGKSARLGIPL